MRAARAFCRKQACQRADGPPLLDGKGSPNRYAVLSFQGAHMVAMRTSGAGGSTQYLRLRPSLAAGGIG
jgi:hypothetical protein